MKTLTDTEEKEFFIINNELNFDPIERVILSSSNGMRVHLTNIVSKMLCYFCRNSQTLINYDDIMQFVWGEKYRQVSYGSMYQALLVLRKSLKKIATSDIEIKSIRKAGIIFYAVVEKKNNLYDSVNNICINSKSVSKKLKKLLARLTLPFSIFFLFINIYLNSDIGLKNSVFENYTPGVKYLGQCNVRFNSNASDSDKHLRFLDKYKNLCVSGGVLFITANENTSYVSVVQCKNKYFDNKNLGNCGVFLFTFEDK